MAGGTGPSTYARVAEITSGRAISQQGLTATCKDRVHKEDSEGARRVLVGAWARRSDEGGVTPSEATREVAPIRVTPRAGKGALGTGWPTSRDRGEDMTGIAWSNLPSGTITVANVEARRETDWPVHYPPTVAHHLGCVLVSAARRVGKTTGTEGCMRVSALSLPHRWAGPLSDKWRAEPRSEPDSGNPTVRDRRAALKNP